MNYFILFIAVPLSSIGANASNTKTVSVIRGIYSESLVNDTLIIDSCPNDTVIYTGVFNSRGDSVSISMSTSEKIDVFIRPISHNQYTTCFYCNNQVVDSLNAQCEYGSVFVRENYYMLSHDSYNNFMKVRSVLALSHLIIDCFGDYPRDILKLLNINWNIDFYQWEYDAMVSLFFNAGAGVKAPSLRKHLKNGDYTNAGKQFNDITNNDTKGLVYRRAAEMDMFLNGNKNYVSFKNNNATERDKLVDNLNAIRKELKMKEF